MKNSLDAEISTKFGFIFAGLAKLIALLMVPLLVGSSSIGLMIYFIK